MTLASLTSCPDVRWPEPRRTCRLAQRLQHFRASCVSQLTSGLRAVSTATRGQRNDRELTFCEESHASSKTARRGAPRTKPRRCLTTTTAFCSTNGSTRAMHASIALTARAAWKGEFPPPVGPRTFRDAHRPAGPSFVVFPGMQEARKTGKPIRTMSRSSTIIPNFVGCAPYGPSLKDFRAHSGDTA
jgi:hypothetical protein